jgi:hypothetical protein
LSDGFLSHGSRIPSLPSTLQRAARRLSHYDNSARETSGRAGDSTRRGLQALDEE